MYRTVLKKTVWYAVSGRTDLRKGVSEAKFDGQADFDVKKSLAPPKSAENHEKPKKNCEKISIFFFFSIFFRQFFSVFRDFLQILEEQGIFRRLTKNVGEIFGSKNNFFAILV